MTTPADTIPRRIQLRRTKGWRLSEGAIVVARPSRWGNPFDIKRFGLDDALALYQDMVNGIWNPSRCDGWHDAKVQIAYEDRERWLARIRPGHPLDRIRFELHGHDLACWCPLDQPCHADVLLELANR